MEENNQPEETVEAVAEPSDFAEAITHTILEVWQELFSNIEKEEGLRVSPQAAMAIQSSWPRLSIKEYQAFTDLYYSFLGEFREVIDTLVEENPVALVHVEDDVEHNHDLYVEAVARWQKTARAWEDAWQCGLPDAEVRLYAMVDAINFVLSSQGLVSHLDQIGMILTSEDEALMQSILDEEE